MKIHSTKFQGLLILEPKLFKDSRGAFYESWREQEYKDCGIKESFVQDNISVNHNNVLRGLHFQRGMGQLVTVSMGKIWDVVVDIRPSSSTFGQYFSIELSGESPQQLYMPPGFAHGFCVLTDIAIVNYKCTQYYDPAQEGGLFWRDTDLNIPWPIKEPIVSEKDQQFPSLATMKETL